MIEILQAATKFLRAKARETITVGVLLVLGIVSVLMYGVAAANLQSILMILMRLAALFVWASISGWVLDLANNTGFGNDKKLIDGGNVAVAISRTGGFAALVLGGALLLAQI